jgi:HlyD family secretion protein
VTGFETGNPTSGQLSRWGSRVPQLSDFPTRGCGRWTWLDDCHIFLRMDIARPDLARKKKLRRYLYLGAALVAVPIVTIGVSRLKPAAPSVERSTVWVDTVRRGEMLRQVRGLGTLVPEDIRWIPAVTEGRVERSILKPGAVVKPDSIILELSNPDLEQQLLNAEWALKKSEAELANLRVQLESQLLDQRATEAQIQADATQARLESERDDALLKLQIASELNAKISRARSESLSTRLDIEKQRLAIAERATQAQLAAKQAEVEQNRALYELRLRQRDALHVRAGLAGVLQLVPVEVGQQVSPGANLARVADPTRLKAEIRIPETQAKDVQIGQKAEVDTRNGVVAGTVARIDPSVQNGTVTVDITIPGALPQGARPDLSVDGTIEIERLANILYVGRPVQGQPNSTVSLFKLVDGGNEAVRTRAELGRSSVNTIEVVKGLQVDDQVILSDMSAWDAYDRIRLN